MLRLDSEAWECRIKRVSLSQPLVWILQSQEKLKLVQKDSLLSSPLRIRRPFGFVIIIIFFFKIWHSISSSFRKYLLQLLVNDVPMSEEEKKALRSARFLEAQNTATSTAAAVATAAVSTYPQPPIRRAKVNSTMLQKSLPPIGGAASNVAVPAPVVEMVTEAQDDSQTQNEDSQTTVMIPENQEEKNEQFSSE